MSPSSTTARKPLSLSAVNCDASLLGTTRKPPLFASALSASRPDAYAAGAAVPVKASTSNTGPVSGPGCGSGVAVAVAVAVGVGDTLPPTVVVAVAVGVATGCAGFGLAGVAIFRLRAV